MEVMDMVIDEIIFRVPFSLTPACTLCLTAVRLSRGLSALPLSAAPEPVFRERSGDHSYMLTVM